MSKDFYKDLSDLWKIDPNAITIAGLNTNLIGVNMNNHGGNVTIGIDTETALRLIADPNYFIGWLLLVDRRSFERNTIHVL